MSIQMTNDMKARPTGIGSVEKALAVRRAAETRNTVCGAVFALELVVVGELFVCDVVSMYSSILVCSRRTYSLRCPLGHK